jgi:hypothetical protein
MSKTHLFECDGSLRGLVQLINRLLVVTEIDLAANQNDRKALAEVKNLRDPLQYCSKSAGVLISYTKKAGREQKRTFS